MVNIWPSDRILANIQTCVIKTLEHFCINSDIKLKASQVIAKHK